MVGQIKSYISILDINNCDELANRINNMINDLSDNNIKVELLGELNEKLLHINELKSLRKKEDKVEKIDFVIPQKKDNSTAKSKENLNDIEIQKKIDEYFHHNEKRNNKKTSSHCNILISQQNLIKIGLNKINLNKNSFILCTNKEKVKIIPHAIPKLPILTEKKKTIIPYGVIPYGMYIDSNKDYWIVNSGILIIKDHFSNKQKQFNYKIDNFVMNYELHDGSIKTITFKPNGKHNYNIYEKDKLINSISYMGKNI